MEPRKITVRQPDGALSYIRYELPKDYDLTPFKKLGEELKNECRFSIDEKKSFFLIWYDFRK